MAWLTLFIFNSADNNPVCFLFRFRVNSLGFWIKCDSQWQIFCSHNTTPKTRKTKTNNFKDEIVIGSLDISGLHNKQIYKFQ